ncbi:hypothetical protein H4R24_001324 [Coemansia sp. RSA 988]|nr:hypothetical protein H4R24_001324 [Coemansia sp. RSA 988]
MEFSQRPAHPALSGTHGFITAVTATAPASTHYSYAGQDPRQSFYGSPVYAHQQHHQQHQQQQVDIQPGNPRRLPSVSELLVSHDHSPQQVAAPQHSASYAPCFVQPDLQPQHHYMPSVYSHNAYQPVDASKAYAIDVPGAQAAGYVAQAHRDSESSSSVSSQTTIVGNYSPTAHYSAAKQRPQQQQMQNLTAIDRGMCEEDVFNAASILMSLRACKMPC